MANSLIVRKDHLPQAQKMHRAAQYVRMSTDLQKYSTENQAAVIAAYAAIHGLTIVRTYRDDGESGLKIEKRAGLTALIRDVQSGEADFGHLLILDVSRWGRFQDVDESAHYEFLCRKAGIKVVYCAEQFDNDGSLLSSIVKNIKRVMAAEYSRELSGKVHAGALRLAALGFKMGGSAPYGLQRLVVDERSTPKGLLGRGERKFLASDRVRLCRGRPDQTTVVRWIYEQYLSGKSPSGIARELNRRGIANSRGDPWCRNAIRDLLRNEAYIGTFIYNRTTEKLETKRAPNPQSLWIRKEGIIEPTVERNVFLRVQKVMAERRCIKIPEEEMLLRLRKLLMKKGKLSSWIIDECPGMPSVSSFLAHFGTLKNVYRLIGYTGNQHYWDKLAAHKQWVEFHLQNAARLRVALEQAGSFARLDRSAKCLRLDKAENVSFRVARWCKYGGRVVHWMMRNRVRRLDGWVVILRLGENNQATLDYLLLPSASLLFNGPWFRVSEVSRAAHNIERFDTFEELSRSLVKRLCKTTRATRYESNKAVVDMSKPKRGCPRAT
ncbi:recombinase family protein [Bradyrhizobium sp. USDA 4529]